MTRIIASSADLFALARSRKPEVVVVLPHAYEAVQSLRRMGSRYRFVKTAPSIAGKIALLSLGGAMETEDDLKLFTTLSPVCGMKDGHIVNVTGHALPFDDGEEDLEAPENPVSDDVDDYGMQRIGNEWYYYEFANSKIQSSVLRYIHGLATMSANLGQELSR